VGGCLAEVQNREDRFVGSLPAKGLVDVLNSIAAAELKAEVVQPLRKEHFCSNLGVVVGHL
jgi:hypothetical protein